MVNSNHPNLREREMLNFKDKEKSSFIFNVESSELINPSGAEIIINLFMKTLNKSLWESSKVCQRLKERTYGQWLTNSKHADL